MSLGADARLKMLASSRFLALILNAISQSVATFLTVSRQGLITARHIDLPHQGFFFK